MNPVEIISVSAGAGHVRAAQALEAARKLQCYVPLNAAASQTIPSICRKFPPCFPGQMNALASACQFYGNGFVRCAAGYQNCEES